MPFPIILIPVAISAVQSLLRYRVRVGHILAVKKTSDALPFTLPPLPKVNFEHTTLMAEYFNTKQGQLLLEAANMSGTFTDFQSGRPAPNHEEDHRSTEALLQDHREAGPSHPPLGSSLSLNSNAERALAYYMVDSYRLSASSATTRILLATADILMEFAGDNAALFISNPKTASIVTTLLREFAAKHDFNEQSLDNVFKKLLGSAVIAALDNKGSLPDHPALLVLYSALGDVRQKMGKDGDDFIAKIISAEGFQTVVSSYLTTTVKDPSFMEMLAKLSGTESLDEPKRRLVREVFGATLMSLGKDFQDILEDPAQLTGVLDAAIATAAKNANGVIRVLGDEKPLLSVVLEAVAGQVASRKSFFNSIGSGELVGAMYKASLEAVAANPKSMVSQLDVNMTVEKIVGGLAEELSRNSLMTTLQSLKSEKGMPLVSQLVSRAIQVLGENPQIMMGNNAFGNAMIGSVLEAGADLIRDGLDVDDLLKVARVGINSATNNLEFAKMDYQLRTLLQSVGELVNSGDIKEKLATTENRRDTLLLLLQTVASNPKVWNEMNQRDMAQPLVMGVLHGLAKDPTNLLSGPVMVDAFKQGLRAISRRGTLFIQRENSSKEVEAVVA